MTIRCVGRLLLAAGLMGMAAGRAAAQTSPVPIPDLRQLTPETRERIAGEAITFLRAVSASDIDDALPEIRLDRWLESVFRIPAFWEMTDCGRERRDGHGPVCIKISQASRAVDMLIVLGDDERGIVDRPRMMAGAIRLFDIDSRFTHLAELPDMLNEAEARRLRFADHPMQTLTAADVVRLRASVRASALQRDLPGEPFDAWFRALLPKDTPVDWNLTSCSGVPSAAAPQCVNVDVRWRDGARARVTLDLEMVQRGLAADPAFGQAFIYRGGASRRVEPYSSLREFADVVRTFAAERQP